MQLDDANLADYARDLGLVASGEGLRIESAGDGNINYVRRLRTAAGRSWILKHARPTLERFPEYAVSPQRLIFEHRFGETVRWLAPAEAELLPAVLHFDPNRYVLVMEDLGDGPRLDGELAALRVKPATLHRLGRFLGSVRSATRAHVGELTARFRNDEMRSLHGEHIFTLPYELGAFPLSPQVRRVAEAALERPGVRNRIRELRSDYYGRAESLVHGDVQAGNVILQEGTPRLLDAEIAHVGDPAFDMGTALAHVHFHVALHPEAAALAVALAALLAGFREAGGTPSEERRAHNYAGVELLRRTLGAARVPWVASEQAACATLNHALGLLLS